MFAIIVPLSTLIVNREGMERRGGRRMENQNWEEQKKVQNQTRNEIIELFRKKNMTYAEALGVLENAHSYLERAAKKILV